MKLDREHVFDVAAGEVCCFSDGNDEASASRLGIFWRCPDGGRDGGPCWHRIDPDEVDDDALDVVRAAWTAYMMMTDPAERLTRPGTITVYCRTPRKGGAEYAS